MPKVSAEKKRYELHSFNLSGTSARTNCFVCLNFFVEFLQGVISLNLHLD